VAQSTAATYYQSQGSETTGSTMNERIKELIEQSTTRVDAVPNVSMAYSYFDTEKFAELIVRECAKIAYNKQYKHSSAHTRGDCAEAIKETFRS
jgi:hypothetical protein